MIWLLIISILSIRGKVLFDLYRETHDVKYKKAMDVLVKQLEHHPRTLKGGFWHKLVYQHQMWLDGLYMASPFLAQYGAEFNRPDLIDEAVKQFRLCHEYTYDARTGLYYHAWMKVNLNVGLIRKRDIRLISGDAALAGGLWLLWMLSIIFLRIIRRQI